MSNENNSINVSTDQIQDDDMNITLTEEQIKEVYDSLEEVNPDADKLAAASQDTEESNYTEIEELNQETAEKVLPENVIKQSILDYDLGITDEDALELTKLIGEYAKDKSAKMYDRLPPTAKIIVNNIVANINTTQNKNNRISKENATKFFLDNFINDAELASIVDEFNNSMNQAYSEMGSEMTKLFSEAFDEEFSKIEEYEATDPEKAERIKIVKQAFEDAKPPFTKLLEWVERVNLKRFVYKKEELRYNNETAYFNNKVNVTEVKIPDIKELFDVLKLYDPSRSDKEIRRFIIAICGHVYNQDFTDIGNISYIYRLVDTIYKYKFVPTVLEDESAKEIFGAISVIMDKINSL